MAKNVGFKTAFGAQTNSSSVLNNSYLENTDQKGSISYEIFGASEKGAGNTNTNNIYMNGIYMKGFNYSNYSKGIKVNSDNALFALACGQNGMENSSRVIEALDSLRNDICRSDNKNAEKYINSVLGTVHNTLISENSLDTVGIGGLYITKTGITHFGLSGVGVYRVSQNGLEPVSEENGYGRLGMTSNVSANIISYPVQENEETYLICSDCITSLIPYSMIMQMIENKTSEEAVKALIKQASKLCGGADVSAIMISLRRSGMVVKPSKKSLIAAIAIIVAAAAVSAGIFLPELIDKKTNHVGVSITEFKKSANIEEEKKLLEEDISRMNEVAERLDSYSEENYQDNVETDLYHGYVKVAKTEIQSISSDYDNLQKNVEILDFEDAENQRKALLDRVNYIVEDLNTFDMEIEKYRDAKEKAKSVKTTTKPKSTRKPVDNTKHTEKPADRYIERENQPQSAMTQKPAENKETKSNTPIENPAKNNAPAQPKQPEQPKQQEQPKQTELQTQAKQDAPSLTARFE